MYEEKEYNFNWVSLFIKVVIFVVFILLAVWLISRITFKDEDEANATFSDNLQMMKNVALEYFDGENLPENDGDKVKLTLRQMIDMGLISEFTSDGESCDTEDSYAEAEKTDDYYTIKVNLKCGDKEDYIYTTLGTQECADCDNIIGQIDTSDDNDNTTNKDDKTEDKVDDDKVATNDEKKDESTSNNSGNSSSGSNNNQSNNNGKKIYYEYAKLVTGTKKVSYSTYCKIEYKDYYSIPYVSSSSGNSMSYTLRLMNLPSNISNVSIVKKSGLRTYNDFSNAYNRNEDDLEMLNDNANANTSSLGGSVSRFQNSSLKATDNGGSNFNFTLSTPYKSGYYYYVKVNMNIKNTSGVTPFYDSYLKRNIYFVPIHFQVKYTNRGNCYDTSTNEVKSGYSLIGTKVKNETYTYADTNQTKWSTATSLDGYKATGNSEWR